MALGPSSDDVLSWKRSDIRRNTEWILDILEEDDGEEEAEEDT